MSYVSDTFNRVSLQQIASFFIYGDEFILPKKGTYEQRIDRAWESLIKEIKELHPEIKDTDKIFEHITYYTSVIEEIYMEIGLKCGAELAIQLLGKESC